MNKGKWKCEELKRVRAEVARANGIAWEERECSFEGECKGTCPKCEEELRRLTRMIKEKEGARVVGVAPLKRIVVGMGVALASGVGMSVAAQEEVGNVEAVDCKLKLANEVDSDEMMGVIVEKKASFPGGQGCLFEYLKENMVYPEECVRDSVEGRVIVQFMVEKDGSISEVSVLRGSGNLLLDEEAVRVVKEMPKWSPAEHIGKKVRSKFMLPVVFKLKE